MIGSLLRVRKEGEEFDLQKNTNKAFWQSSIFINADWMPGFEFYSSKNITLGTTVFELLKLNQKDLSRDIFTADETITLDPTWITTAFSNKSNRYLCYINDAYEFDFNYELNIVYQLKITLNTTEIYHTEPFFQGDFDEGIPASMTLTTNQASLQAVGITLTFPAGSIFVDWGDGGALESFTTAVEKIHNYSSTGTYIIKIQGDQTNITKFIFDNSKIILVDNIITGILTDFRCQINQIVGDLDFTTAKVSGTFYVYSNAGLTGLIFASSGNSLITDFTAYACDLTGVLDLTNVPVSGIFRVESNGNLEGITFASSGNAKVTLFLAYACDITGVLDLTNVPIGSQMQVRSNPNMTGVIFASSGNTLLDTLYMYACNLTGVLDLSNVPLYGFFWCHTNPNLTGVTFSGSGNGQIISYLMYSCNLGYVDFTVGGITFSGNNANLQLQNNSMTAAEVNHILVDLYSLVSGESGGGDYTGRSIDISGTNAAPDGSSGGYDGLTAKTNLQGKGFTVTTT